MSFYTCFAYFWLHCVTITWGKPPEKQCYIYRFKNTQYRLRVHRSCGPSGRGTIENGVVHCCVVQTGEIFTGDVRCENNDRLATMHTSDHRRLVWYENQCPSEVLGRLLKKKKKMMKKMMTRNSKIACERFLV